MRGGSSRVVVFEADSVEWGTETGDALLLTAVGSGDPRQIDGLGGAAPDTSKVAVVGPSGDEAADIECAIGQIGVATAAVDWSAPDPDVVSAVALFAVEEHLVPIAAAETLVRVRNAHTGDITTVGVGLEAGGVAELRFLAIADELVEAATTRTARRIADGHVLVPLLDPEVAKPPV
jgi:2-methylaconitate cis-trans-isomerase PrpF